MPKHFNPNYGFKGFFENNDYYTYQSEGTYEAPSDWVIYINYNSFVYDGSVLISSEVVEFDEDDISKINDEWQPTGTFYINKTQIAEEKAYAEAEVKRKADELAEKLKAANDAAETAKVRSAAAKSAEVARQKQQVEE